MDVNKENNHKHESVQLSPQKMNDIKRKEREALQDHICNICHVKMNSRQGLSAHIKREHEGVMSIVQRKAAMFPSQQEAK